MDDLPIEIPEDTAEKPPTLRGWWDYVPNAQDGSAIETPRTSTQVSAHRPPNFSLPGLRRHNTQQSHSTPRVSETVSNQHLNVQSTPTYRRASPTPSSLNRLGRLVPNMELFRNVMKDEVGRV